MADETLLKDLMQLDLSEYTTAPYNITTNPNTDKEPMLLSDYIRGTTIGDEWKTPAQDTLTIKNDKPGFLGKIGWAFGTTAIDAIRNTPAGLAIAGLTKPVETIVGAVGATKGATAGSALAGKLLTKTAGLPKYISAPLNFTGKLGGAVAGGAAGLALAGGALLTAKEGFEIKPAGEQGETDPVRIITEAKELYAKKKITEEQYNKRLEEARMFQKGREQFLQNESVDLLKGRDYPDADVASSVLSWATDWIQDRKLLRAVQAEQRGQNPNDFSYQAGAVAGSLAPIIAANYLYRSALLRPRYETLHPGSRFRETIVEKANPFTREQISDKLQNFGKAFIGTQELANYTAETVSDYVERTGDKDLVYYQPSDIQGLMAGGYAAINAITEYELGGLEDIITGSFKKVGIKTPLAYAYGKAALQEGGEEFVQQLEEFLARKIDGTTDKTWGEALKEALIAGAWGAAMGGFVGGTVFKINRSNLVKGIMKFGEEKGIKIDEPTATKVADTMMETVEGSLDPKKKDLWNNLRGKISVMLETSDIANKEDRIDSITDLEYALIAADAGFDGIDIENHPLFQGEVNKLGWFRAGIPEESRAVVNDLLAELNDLETQLKTLNEAKEKDWEKIDEIERRLEQFDRYVLDKLGENAPASLRELDNELRKVENKYVQKEKQKYYDNYEATPEQKQKSSETASFLAKELNGSVIGGEDKERKHGSAYVNIDRPRMKSIKIRLGVTPINNRHKSVVANFNIETMTPEEILAKARELIADKYVRTNKKTNVNFGFGETKAQPLFQDEVFKIADENARLDDIYPAYDGETIEVDGKERTVYNSNGDRIAKSKEALTNFWKWFGDSKVVDEQGRPQVVYHATNAEFDTFDKQKQGTGHGSALGKGFYFSTYEYQGEDYGKNVMPVYLKIENPMTLEGLKSQLDDIIKMYLKDGATQKDIEFQRSYVGAKTDSILEMTDFLDGISRRKNIPYSEILNKLGFDGIFFREQRVALEPTQIKSVDNRGTFSEKTGNIYFQPAYAGSRVDYDRPSLEAIGSGQGAASHGWGLYYALDPVIAEHYRRLFTNIYTLNHNRFDSGLWKYCEQDGKYYMNLHTENIKEAIEISKDEYEQEYLKASNKRLSNEDKSYIGQVHEVDIPEMVDLLDEQKTYNEQSEYVKKALRNMLYSVRFEEYYQKGQTAEDFVNQEITDWEQGFTGGQIYDRISNLLDGDKEASLLMKEYGVKGITYFGQQDGRCFVIFDTEDVKVLRKKFDELGNMLFQNRPSGAAPSTYRGAYIPQYRFIQRTNKMDASTLSHEMAHDWFEINFDKFRSGKASPEFMRAWGALEKALGITDKSTKAEKNKASEAFARAYEGWIMNNKGWEKLINVDDKDRDDVIKLMLDYQSDLRDIYQDLTNPYFKQTWGKLGEMKPEIKAWFDKVVNITDIDKLVERGEMTPEQASQEKLNQAIDTVIENTEDADTKKTLKTMRVLNDTKRYEAEGGNKNSLQVRLANLAKAIDENNMLIKENYDTHRDMLEVAKQADNFVKTRLEDALAIINGQMAEQEGLFKEDIYTALERLALENGDLNLLDELKNSEVANRLAKELGQRVAGFRNWNAGDVDVVSSLKALDNKFNKALQNKKAQAQMAEAGQMFAKAQEQQDKLADKELDSVLKDMECR